MKKKPTQPKLFEELPTVTAAQSAKTTTQHTPAELRSEAQGDLGGGLHTLYATGHLPVPEAVAHQKDHLPEVPGQNRGAQPWYNQPLSHSAIVQGKSLEESAGLAAALRTGMLPVKEALEEAKKNSNLPNV